jgi:predicted DNA-binding WGR domain protein
MSASGVCTQLEICFTKGDKFWEVTVEGSRTATRQGIIGAECAAEGKDHSSEQTAQALATAQGAAKRELGYFDSVQLSGMTLPDGPFLYLDIDDDDEPLDEDERDLVEISSSLDHLLAGVALNRVDEGEEFLARHGNDISSHRLLCTLYAAMMCGHDAIASELSEYVAADTTRGDPGVEPVIYLCWTLLCVGWCASTESTLICVPAQAT